MFNRLQHESRELIDELVRITWYMRGGIQYEDLLQRTFYERQSMVEFINARMEVQLQLPPQQIF